MCHVAFFFIIVLLPGWSTQVLNVKIEEEASTQNSTITGNSTITFKEVSISESELYGGAYSFLFSTHLAGILLAFISMIMRRRKSFSKQYMCDLSSILVYEGVIFYSQSVIMMIPENLTKLGLT